MTAEGRTGSRRRVGSWVWRLIGLILVVLLVGLFVLKVPSPFSKHVVGLLALEAAYGIALVTAPAGLPVFGVILLRARARRTSRPAAARGFLLCASILSGLALAEVAAAAWPAQTRRLIAIPGSERASKLYARTHYLLSEPEEIELPTEFPTAPDDDTLNLVVVGESSAKGHPYHLWVSVGAIVQWQLEEAIPGRRVRLEILAESGSNLERQHRKLAGLTRRPDALIIYCGHSEFMTRIPWSREVSHYLDGPPPTLWETYTTHVERSSPLCGLIRESIDKYRIATPPPWPGRPRTLVDVPHYTPAEFAALERDFRSRLERIVAYAERVGAVPILIVPPANDSGFEPSRSFLRSQTPYADREAIAREFEAARRLEATEPAQAMRDYRALLAREPGFAIAHYRLARLLEHADSWEEAYQHDVVARDQDGLPIRCPTRFQDAYRDVASRHPCILIDGQAYFHAIGRHGLLNDSLFHDAMHPSLRGQIALAQAVLQGLHERRAFGWPEGSPAPRIDPARCVEHFGLGKKEWLLLCEHGSEFWETLARITYDPSQRRARRDLFIKARERLVAGEAPEAVGLPCVGIPAVVPVVPGCAILTKPRAEHDRTGGSMPPGAGAHRESARKPTLSRVGGIADDTGLGNRSRRLASPGPLEVGT